MSLLVRPTAPPRWLGLVVAASFIVAETILVRLLMVVAPGNTFGAVYLLGVLVVSARWGFGLSAMTTLASTLAYGYVHFADEGSFLPTEVKGWVAILTFLPIAIIANVVAGQARLRTAEADQRRLEAEASRDQIRVLADQQAALHRVATLVARGGTVRGVLSGGAGVSLLPWRASRDAVSLRDRWLVHLGRCPRREREGDPAGRHATLVRG